MGVGWWRTYIIAKPDSRIIQTGNSYTGCRASTNVTRRLLLTSRNTIQEGNALDDRELVGARPTPITDWEAVEGGLGAKLDGGDLTSSGNGIEMIQFRAQGLNLGTDFLFGSFVH